MLHSCLWLWVQLHPFLLASKSILHLMNGQLCSGSCFQLMTLTPHQRFLQAGHLGCALPKQVSVTWIGTGRALLLWRAHSHATGTRTFVMDLTIGLAVICVIRTAMLHRAVEGIHMRALDLSSVTHMLFAGSHACFC